MLRSAAAQETVRVLPLRSTDAASLLAPGADGAPTPTRTPGAGADAARDALPAGARTEGVA